MGKTARVKQPKMRALDWTVTVIEPGRAFTWESKSSGVHAVASHSVEAIDRGRSRAFLSIEGRGPLAWFADLLYGRMGKRYVEMEAAGLKRRSESPTAV